MLNQTRECLTSDFKNPKQFWKKIKTIIYTSDKHCIHRIRVADTVLHDFFSVSQAFNQHFSLVCSNLLPNSHLTTISFGNTSPRCSSFSFRKMLPTEVQNAINDLNVNSGAGLDGIENRFIKLASHILVYPLFRGCGCFCCRFVYFWGPFQEGGLTNSESNPEL